MAKLCFVSVAVCVYAFEAHDRSVNVAVDFDRLLLFVVSCHKEPNPAGSASVAMVTDPRASSCGGGGGGGWRF